MGREEIPGLGPCLRCGRRPRAGAILPSPHPSLADFGQYCVECEECMEKAWAEGGVPKEYATIRNQNAPMFVPVQARVHNPNYASSGIGTPAEKCINYDHRGELVSIFAKSHPVWNSVLGREEKAGLYPRASPYEMAGPYSNAGHPQSEAPLFTEYTRPNDFKREGNDTIPNPQRVPTNRHQGPQAPLPPTNTFVSNDFRRILPRPTAPPQFIAVNKVFEAAEAAARKATVNIAGVKDADVLRSPEEDLDPELREMLEFRSVSEADMQRA
ncbi:hypothetical protein K458DRAFT_29444 [Lentithecium fluviatile CBS 122367]|uniref:Uncharacterized protein n=1 Tax=Lentithecium fluviatile CBS 122367 TaxID=1168545 RepID=A0A6G1J3A4_9PLEO|nr:hypothetical protein K458DRAFT_29444 [Lentithecium fluviatile CBS 122367]